MATKTAKHCFVNYLTIYYLLVLVDSLTNDTESAAHIRAEATQITFVNYLSTQSFSIAVCLAFVSIVCI